MLGNNFKSVWASHEDACAKDQVLTQSYVLGNNDGGYGAGYLLAGGDKAKICLLPKDLSLGHKAEGTIQYTDNPANGETTILNGVTITFVTSGATGNQVNIGATLPDTLDNLLALLDATTEEDLLVATYAEDGTDTLTITYKVIGAIGETYTMAGTAEATLSGSTLDGAITLVSMKVEIYTATKSGDDFVPDDTLIETITREMKLDDLYDDDSKPIIELTPNVNDDVFAKVYVKTDILANSGSVDVKLASVA